MDNNQYIRCASWFEAIQQPRLPHHTFEFCHKNLRVCSQHFEPKDISTNKIRKRLHPDAVPVFGLCVRAPESAPIVPVADTLPQALPEPFILIDVLDEPNTNTGNVSHQFEPQPSTSTAKNDSPFKVNKRRRKNIDSCEDDSTSDSSKLIGMPIDDRGASRHLQCQSDENMSDSDSVINIIKHEIDIPEYVPDLQEAETIMIKDDEDDDDDSNLSTYNIEEINIKEEPINEQNNFDDRHPVDVFCKSVALSLKSLRKDLCNEGKIRIMQLISELEQRNSLPNEGPCTSKSMNNRAEPTSTVTNYLVPKKELD
ncbi:unnamed protein product [Ceutorhynchus assimilis]|uniref:THAP-type domain-containing protein n=1 Tax=Ceutorhynchus assimilis TaxID=467358 RepID=A0A9P0GQ36_9CUCU|nr:unnamed protein product [Ceutorhynchus assimilis]